MVWMCAVWNRAPVPKPVLGLNVLHNLGMHVVLALAWLMGA